MADINFGVSVDGGNSYASVGSAAVSATGSNANLNVNDNYSFRNVGTSEYVFVTDKAGNYTGKVGGDATVLGFDASYATGKVAFDDTGLTGIASIKSGDGNDSITATVATAINTGDGNDYVFVKSANASVTMGGGADTVQLDTNTAYIADYKFSEGDVVSLAAGYADLANSSASKEGFVKLGNGTETASVSAEKIDGAMAVKANGQTVVFTTGSATYHAKGAVSVIAAADADAASLTTLTLGSDTTGGSYASVNAADDGKTYIVSSRKADAVSVNAGTLYYGISDNDGFDTVEYGGTDFVLTLTNSKDVTKVSVDATDQKFVYGKTEVSTTGVIDSAKEGTFKVWGQGTAEEDAVKVAYGSAAADSVTYASDVKYYLGAASVVASNEAEANINLNGDGTEYAKFAKEVNAIVAAESGYVVGRNDSATNIFVNTAADKVSNIYGGSGKNSKDIITLTAGDGADVIWYSIGDGNDTVNNFESANDSVFFYNASANLKALADVVKYEGTALTAKFATDNKLTLEGVNAGDTVSFVDQDNQVLKVAVGNADTVAYATDTKIYTNAATLTVDSYVADATDTLQINLSAANDEYGYYSSDIINLDASDVSSTAYLVGANKSGATVSGGTNTNFIYGGGDKNQTLVGNTSAVDIFYFGSNDGKDTVQTVNDNDAVYLYNVTDISKVSVKVNDQTMVLTVGSSKLTLENISGDVSNLAIATSDMTNYYYNATSKTLEKKA